MALSIHEVQAFNNLDHSGPCYIKHMLNMLGVNTSITAIYERVLWGYFNIQNVGAQSTKIKR